MVAKQLALAVPTAAELLGGEARAVGSTWRHCESTSSSDAGEKQVRVFREMVSNSDILHII